MITSIIAEHIKEYIGRHITQENNNKKVSARFRFVFVRMEVISKISKKSTRGKISIGLGVKTKSVYYQPTQA